MSADPLPWSERLRRRNGLTPAGAYVDECTVTEVDGTPVAVRGSGTFTERDQEMFAEVVRAAKRRFSAEGEPHRPRPRLSEPDIDGPFSSIPDEHRLLRREPEPRCDLTDLPTTMCHHCKETHNAQP